MIVQKKEPMRLIVAIMNGASASSRAGDKVFFSDVVIRIVQESFEKLKKIVGYSHLVYELYYDKGGLGRRSERKIKEHILKHNKEKNVLLLCGKSYGGWDIARVLRRLYPKLKYSKVHLILIDACWIGKVFNRLLRVKVPPIDKIRNYYQSNMSVLNGARLETRNLSPETYMECDLSMSEFCGEKMTHWNIIHHYAPRLAIEGSVDKLIKELMV